MKQPRTEFSRDGKARALLPWLGIASVMGLAMAARYGLIEPAEVAHLCDSGAGPWWCGVRRLVILSFAHHALGHGALIVGLVATLLRRRLLALAAALLGAAGLVLYEFDFSAVGFLLGVLALARGGNLETSDEYRAGEQDA